MLRKFGEETARIVLDGIGRATSQIHERTPLSVDLLESEQSYLAVFDAPGATAEAVDVRLDGRELSVEIDRARDPPEGAELLLGGRGVRRTGSVTLPSGAVDADATSATLTSAGTLRVRVPKTEPGRGDEPIRIDATDSDEEDEADEE